MSEDIKKYRDLLKESRAWMVTFDNFNPNVDEPMYVKAHDEESARSTVRSACGDIAYSEMLFKEIGPSGIPPGSQVFNNANYKKPIRHSKNLDDRNPYDAKMAKDMGIALEGVISDIAHKAADKVISVQSNSAKSKVLGELEKSGMSRMAAMKLITSVIKADPSVANNSKALLAAVQTDNNSNKDEFLEGTSIKKFSTKSVLEAKDSKGNKISVGLKHIEDKNGKALCGRKTVGDQKVKGVDRKPCSKCKELKGQSKSTKKKVVKESPDSRYISGYTPEEETISTMRGHFDEISSLIDEVEHLLMSHAIGVSSSKNLELAIKKIKQAKLAADVGNTY